jgi:hypothetical protein
MQTIFNLSALPSNLQSPIDWLKFANRAFAKPVSIQTAMRKVAEQRGGAVLLKPDGKLIVITKLQSGKLRTTTYAEGEWRAA